MEIWKLSNINDPSHTQRWWINLSPNERWSVKGEAGLHRMLCEVNNNLGFELKEVSFIYRDIIFYVRRRSPLRETVLFMINNDHELMVFLYDNLGNCFGNAKPKYYLEQILQAADNLIVYDIHSG
jgi:hypothetical protein